MAQDEDGVELFDTREDDYLAWVQAHPEGFVANMDRREQVPEYPMIHRASHRSMSSPEIGNFTTGRYVKYCSLDFDVLQRHLEKRYGRRPTRCATCM